MTISLVSLLLLAIAAYFLIKTKPDLFLYELMKEVFGEAKVNQYDSEDAKKTRNKKPVP
jgi:hypothetical protein